MTSKDEKAKKKAAKQKKAEKKAAKKNKLAKVDSPTKASMADRHDLYQRAVQDCESDVDFLLSAYRDVYGPDAKPVHFREDFCGTAAMCAEWVGRNKRMTAEGFDIDPECLRWGLENNLAPLGDDASRIQLHEQDVREGSTQKADVRCAHNFSYQIFEDRAQLKDYFQRAFEGITEQGIFVLDLYGGSEASIEMEEEREIDDGDFTYVWEQRSFHPATGHTDCFISFRFSDGSEMKDAFAYTWRLYTPPELRDIMLEAGFREVRLFFEAFDEEGDGTGEFERDEKGPACEGWLGYMVAIP